MVIEILNGSGLAQGQIGALTGLHQNRLAPSCGSPSAAWRFRRLET
jgi:hypothetical protein